MLCTSQLTNTFEIIDFKDIFCLTGFIIKIFKILGKLVDYVVLLVFQIISANQFKISILTNIQDHIKIFRKVLPIIFE
jgi:hypothetical protein